MDIPFLIRTTHDKCSSVALIAGSSEGRGAQKGRNPADDTFWVAIWVCDARGARDEAMQTRCAGSLVSDDCWVLSQPGQSCADICEGASRVDAETTVGGAFTNIVVAALEAKYGLHDTSRDRLDAPCGWPPYLAEGEVQFPEWGMVSLPVPTAHGTRHACTHLRSTHG